MFVSDEHILPDHTDKMWCGPAIANQASGFAGRGVLVIPQPTPLSISSCLRCGTGGVCLDDRWTGILVLGKREGEVSGGCARLLQVYSASRVCVAPGRLRGQVCTPRVAAGLGLQINTDKQKLMTEISSHSLIGSRQPDSFS